MATHAAFMPGAKVEAPTFWGAVASWLTTVDHKRIGILYGSSAFIFFLIGGIEALIMRLQLARPDNTLVSAQTFNELFTMHGTTMVFLAIMPMSAAFFNYMIPLMIGARDVAFPRLNALSYWIFLSGGLFLHVSFLAKAVPDGGWFGYANLTSHQFSPTHSHRLLDARPADPRHLVHARGLQLPGDDHQHAGARHDPDADAGVHLDELRDPVPHRARLPGHHGGAHPPHVRPLLRHALLLPRRGRRSPALAAPLLDLRPPGGLHPDPARDGHRLGGAAHLRAQAALRRAGHHLLRASPSASSASGCGATTCSRSGWARWPTPPSRSPPC